MPDSHTRKPRPVVTVNGQTLPVNAVIGMEVTSNSHFVADTYRLNLAIAGLPAAFGPAYWADSDDDLLTLGVEMDDAVQNLITGQVDDAEINLVARTVTLTGRDLSSRLLDRKTGEKFQNLTAGTIATTLAARHGLTADVTQMTAKAGIYYQIDHAVLTRDQTEWDLLVYLAEHEGYDVWVTGTTLHFKPSEAMDAIYTLNWSEPDANSVACRSNALDIRLQRSQTLAGDVIVTVRSWNQKQQASFTKTAKAVRAKKQRSGGQAQTYSFTRPNLTPEQALQFAQAKAEQISRHERILTASMPGDARLTTRTMVRLTGTGTAYDQDYYPDTVTRRLSFDEGYRMELRAKNHSPLSEAVL